MNISKFYFGSRESEKPIFTIFPEIFTRKIGNAGISSETTIPGISRETTETRESLRPGLDREVVASSEILECRARRPGSLERDDLEASSIFCEVRKVHTSQSSG